MVICPISIVQGKIIKIHALISFPLCHITIVHCPISFQIVLLIYKNVPLSHQNDLLSHSMIHSPMTTVQYLDIMPHCLIIIIHCPTRIADSNFIVVQFPTTITFPSHYNDDLSHINDPFSNHNGSLSHQMIHCLSQWYTVQSQ